jgi:hypothetical protein
MIRQPHGPGVPFRQVGQDIQADLLRRTGIGRGTLQHREGHAGLAHPGHRLVDLLQRAHPGGEQDREPGVEHPVEQADVGDLAGRDLPGGHPDPPQQVDRLEGEGRAQEPEAAGLRVLAEAAPLGLGKLHALPIREATLILRAEPDPPGLRRCALGRGDMSLKLHDLHTGCRHGIDVGVRESEAAVVRLGHLGDHDTPSLLGKSPGEPPVGGAGLGCFVVGYVGHPHSASSGLHGPPG